MKRRRSSFVRLALVATFLLASFTSPALAQRKGEEPLPPYDVKGLPHTKVWIPWVFAFLFVAGCLAVAFKNPHRSITERT
ncbi:MAG: hypothetical protein ACE5I3_01385 [Phycisphaerae bacterium]